MEINIDQRDSTTGTRLVFITRICSGKRNVLPVNFFDGEAPPHYYIIVHDIFWICL